MATITAATPRTKMNGTQPITTAEMAVTNDVIALPRGGRDVRGCCGIGAIGESTYR
ncbi:MAG: hypothetical protein QOJ08_2351 [Ilumatobacteraceae bacterium]